MARTPVACLRLLAGLLTLALVVSAPAHGDGLVTHVDAPETVAGPLDLTEVVFGQDGGDMVLRLETTGPWSPADLTAPTGGSLCVLLAYGVPRRRGRICVAGRDGAAILRYARADTAGQLTQERVMAAHVTRPTGRSVLAVFSPDEAGLEAGQRFAWRAESAWAGCGAPAGCVDRVPQRGEARASVADPPAPDQLAPLPTRLDGRDGAPLPLDLAVVSFGQQGADMVLQVVASRAWRTAASRALCVRLFGAALDAPRGRICVAERGGRPALGYEAGEGSALRSLPATVLRPARRSLWATFSPRAVGLRPGWFSWRAESAGAGGVDAVPDAGDVLARVAPAPPPCFGAAARDPRRRCRNPALRLAVVPSPLDAAIEPNAPCRPLARDGLVAPCGFGLDPAARSLALIGDSHAEHWRAAVEVVADAEGRHGLSITRTSCPLTTAKLVAPATDAARRDCARWNREVPPWLARHPAVSTVFVSENTDALIARADQVPGYMGAWKALPGTVKRIVVLRDPPHRGRGGATCILRAMARHRRAGLACAVPRASALAADPAVAAAARLHSRRVRVVDLTRYMCSARLCYPVVGGALVHKDHHHLTAVFARTMGRYLLRAVGRPSGAAAPAAAVAAGSIADAARMCKPPRYPGSGYFTSLSVNGVSCATGRRLMLAYYRCRLRHGRAGRCRATVLGYTCRETRNAIPTEINARVTCKRGRRTIVHTYQQNT